MITEYIQAALDKARYEIIDDPAPYHGSIPNLKGVWATGNTLEECRGNLKQALEGWIVLRLQRGLSIPPVKGLTIRPLQKQAAHAQAHAR